MKLMKILILLLLVKINSSDDTPPTTQHEPYSCGQLKLKEVKKEKVKKCRFSKINPFCHYSYELRFYDLTTTNDTIPDTADNIECVICPYGEEGSCTSQSCNQLQFNCIKISYEDPSPVTHTTATMPQVIDSMTTVNKLLAQSVGQTYVSVLVLGTIIGLLCLLVLMLIAGWSWTCWILKKRAIRLPRTDNGTGLCQHSNERPTSHVQCHYEFQNSLLNQDSPTTTVTRFESSTNYSLLSPENEINSGAGGGRVNPTNGEEEQYSLLDRGSGRGRTKITTGSQQREQMNGYSRLFSN